MPKAAPLATVTNTKETAAAVATTSSSKKAAAPVVKETATTTNSPSYTEVPEDLGCLPKDELVSLLKRVATERDDLRAKKKARSIFDNEQDDARTQSTASVTTMSSSSSSSILSASSFSSKTFKKRLHTTAVRLIKKAAHNRSKKPWTEITDSVPSLEAVQTLMEGFDKSESARMMTWELKSLDVAKWLGCSPFVHRVKFDGKVILGNAKQVYAWAGFDSCQVRFEKKTGQLRCKFRTFMAGSGRPLPGQTTPPSLW